MFVAGSVIVKHEYGDCLICGRPAKGIYYKVLACSGCRTFYERSVRKEPVYYCDAGGKCDNQATRQTEGWCRACRYLKWETAIAAAQGYKSRYRSSRAKLNSGRKKPGGERRGQEDLVTNETNYQDDASTSLVPWKRESSSVASDFYIDRAVPSPGNRSESGSETSFASTCHCRPQVIFHTNMLTARTNEQRDFSPFLFHGKQRSDLLAQTFFAVGNSVVDAFGDQITDWTNSMARALKYPETTKAPTTIVHSMMTALRNHFTEMAHRVMQFRNSLPGYSELDHEAKRRTARPWKMIIASLIYHAPFVTDDDIYFTAGPQRHRFSKYWFENTELTIAPLEIFLYKFNSLIRGIGLNSMERFLLITLLLLEPDGDSSPNIPLSVLHQHYTNVLMCVIEQRCSDPAERTVIYRKLENFFDSLSAAMQIFLMWEYCPCPPIYQGMHMTINQQVNADS